jgi:heptosyltransferase III
MLIGGEADHPALESLTRSLAARAPLVSRGLPLPALARVLAKSAHHFGHDTGISHLAAAVGVPSTVLFGPTDPAIWAPLGGHVRIVCAPEGDLSRLPVGDVLGAEPASP